MAIAAQVIDYRDGDTHFSGFLFADSAEPNKSPGLLLVHGGAGLDDHAKGRAKSFANLGFAVFACDMYGAGVAGDRERIMATLLEMRNDPEKLVRRARSGLDVLTAHAQVDDRLAAIGYCFGGMTVLQMARSGTDIAAVVSVHGSLATVQPAEPGAIKAKILVCHGALDPHVPMPHVTAFADEMKRADADWQLILYGGAMHGFTHESGPAIPGVAYNADADRRSTAAINVFFAEVFGPRKS